MKSNEAPTNVSPVYESTEINCMRNSQTRFFNQTERIIHESSTYLMAPLEVTKKTHFKQRRIREKHRNGIFCKVCGGSYNSIASLRTHQFREYGKDYHTFFYNTESESSDE
jgi:hypothetical protein